MGYGGVLIWVVILVAVFTVLGYLLWLYNRITIENGKLKADFKNLKWLFKPAAPATKTSVAHGTKNKKNKS